MQKWQQQQQQIQQCVLNMMNGNFSGSPSGFASMASGGGHGARGIRPRTKQQQPNGTPCGRCGGKHLPDECTWLKEKKVCQKCLETGHAASHCRSSPVDNQTYKCCGEVGHIKRDCPFNTDICARCNIKGHLVKVCTRPVGFTPQQRQPQQHQTGGQAKNTPGPPKQAAQVTQVKALTKWVCTPCGESIRDDAYEATKCPGCKAPREKTGSAEEKRKRESCCR